MSSGIGGGARLGKDPAQRFEQWPFGAGAVGGIGQDHRQAAAQQRIALGAGGELQRERDEPLRPARSRSGAGHGRVLLEQRQEERAFGGELAVDRAFGESRGVRDLVEGDGIEAAFGEDGEPGLEQQRPSFSLTPALHDPHWYQGYPLGSESPTIKPSRGTPGTPITGSYTYL